MQTKSNLSKNFHISFPLHEQNSLIYVCDIGHHITSPSHSHGPAVRSYYLIHLIEKGKGTIERNGVITNLSEGDAFIIHPNEITTYTSDKNEPWEYYWIGFSGAYSSDVMKKTTSKLFAKYQKSGLIALKNCIKNTSTLDEIEGLKILFSVLDSIKTEKVENRDIVSLALDYIENNYFRPISVVGISSQLGLSRAHFTTVFTKAVGEAPYNYLTKIRINHAKQYLSSTTLSITEIAYSVGFSSIERFSEQFKRYTSVSPIAYRKSHSIL
ncbi:MAG: AraC family transcriptional regulator [Clostridiales bacterium]|nr:AraC family transcriptional regulator [Clostridiales bacterium]